MKFEYLELYNLLFSGTKRAFQMKQKTFFLVSQVLSFRLKKQTNKNVADTIFKHWQYIYNINIKVTKEWMEMCQISHNCNTVIVLKITCRVNMLIEVAKKRCYSMVFSYAFFHIHWVSRFLFFRLFVPRTPFIENFTSVSFILLQSSC